MNVLILGQLALDLLTLLDEFFSEAVILGSQPGVLWVVLLMVRMGLLVELEV